MSDSIKARLEAAVRTEPAVGDPFARFSKRRRASRALRTLSGFVLAAVSMIGFVTIFPGGTGGTPDSGFLPNQPLQPGLDPFRSFEASQLGVRLFIPDDWESIATEEAAVVGPSISGGPGVESIEIRFGDIGSCEADGCSPLTELVHAPKRAAAAGLAVEATTLRVGAVRVNAFEVAFPDGDPDLVAPSCAGCVGFYAELGAGDLPMLVLAADQAALDRASSTLGLVLENVSVR